MFSQIAKRGLAALVAALFLVSGLAATPAQAATGPSKYVEGTDPAAFLYDPLNVNRVDVTLPQDSLRALAADDVNTNQVSWQAGTAVFTSYKGVLPKMDIGLHLKGGWGSRRAISTCNISTCAVRTDTKPGVKIKFDFVPGTETQRLYGLKEITLNSMVQDPSMIRETADYRIARLAGLPAPRTGYARLFVNNVDLGLHMLIETYDKALYKRWFTSGTQHSYEGAYWQDIVNSGNKSYMNMQMKLGDETNRDDLANMAGINDLSGVDWWSEVNKYADMGELTLDWAFERFIEHWDAYSWFIINNYQVHFNGAGIMTMHPWGIDQTLQEQGGDLGVTFLGTSNQSGATVGTMFVKCMGVPQCKALYISQLAKLGAINDALKMPEFIDAVWTAVGNYVLTDRIYSSRSGEATWTKENAKTFLRTRTAAGSEFRQTVTARQLADVSLYYETPKVFVEGQQFEPLLMNNTQKEPTFKRMGSEANPTCNVDPAMGTVTALTPGWCVISVSTPQDTSTSGYHAGYAIYYLNLGKYNPTITYSPLKSIAYLRSVPFEISSNSTGELTVTTNANCTYSAGVLRATVQSGICQVNVAVAKDATHYSGTSVFKVTISKEVVSNYLISKDAGWTATTKLPYKRTINLVNKPSKVVGKCKVVGKVLTASAASGTCTVTIPGWSTSTLIYPTKTFRVVMSPNPQTWIQKVAAAVTRKKIGVAPYQLVNSLTITTTAGQEGLLSNEGDCELGEGVNSIFVQMTGPGLCTVTLEADPGFKVAAIKRVWTFTQ